MSGLLTNNAILKLADFLCLLGQLEGSKTPTECPRRGVVGGGNAFASRLDQLLDLSLKQIFPWPIGGVSQPSYYCSVRCRWCRISHRRLSLVLAMAGVSRCFVIGRKANSITASLSPRLVC